MFKIMKEKAPNYLISLVPKLNQPSEQGTTAYPSSTVEQIVLSYLFFALH